MDFSQLKKQPPPFFNNTYPSTQTAKKLDPVLSSTHQIADQCQPQPPVTTLPRVVGLLAVLPEDSVKNGSVRWVDLDAPKGLIIRIRKNKALKVYRFSPVGS